MSKKILVIDDEPDIREILRLRLQANQYEVLTASDGRQGLRLLAEQRPDVIVLDVMMPNMDGVTFIGELKKIEAVKNTPVIVLTAKEMMEDLLVLEGIKDCIVKPFQAEQLLETIRKYV